MPDLEPERFTHAWELPKRDIFFEEDSAPDMVLEESALMWEEFPIPQAAEVEGFATTIDMSPEAQAAREVPTLSEEVETYANGGVHEPIYASVLTPGESGSEGKIKSDFPLPKPPKGAKNDAVDSRIIRSNYPPVPYSGRRSLFERPEDASDDPTPPAELVHELEEHPSEDAKNDTKTVDQVETSDDAQVVADEKVDNPHARYRHVRRPEGKVEPKWRKSYIGAARGPRIQPSQVDENAIPNQEAPKKIDRYEIPVPNEPQPTAVIQHRRERGSSEAHQEISVQQKPEKKRWRDRLKSKVGLKIGALVITATTLVGAAGFALTRSNDSVESVKQSVTTESVTTTATTLKAEQKVVDPSDFSTWSKAQQDAFLRMLDWIDKNPGQDFGQALSNFK